MFHLDYNYPHKGPSVRPSRTKVYWPLSSQHARRTLGTRQRPSSTDRWSRDGCHLRGWTVAITEEFGPAFPCEFSFDTCEYRSGNPDQFCRRKSDHSHVGRVFYRPQSHAIHIPFTLSRPLYRPRHTERPKSSLVPSRTSSYLESTYLRVREGRVVGHYVCGKVLFWTGNRKVLWLSLSRPDHFLWPVPAFSLGRT